MLKNFPLILRIATPIFIVACGLLLVGTILITEYRSKYNQATGMTYSAKAIEAVSNVIHETQKERALSSLYMNNKISKDELEKHRSKVDEEFKNIFPKIAEVNSPALSEESKKMPLELSAVRAKVNNGAAIPEVLGAFGNLMNTWIKNQIIIANAYHLDGVEATMISIAIFEKSKESMGRLRAQTNGILGSDAPVSSELISLMSSHKSGILSNLESPGLSISDKGRAEVKKILESEDWKQVSSVFDGVVTNSATGKYGYDAKVYSQTITRVIDSVHGIIKIEIANVSSKMSSMQTKAKLALYGCIVGIFALLLFSTLFAFFISKAINNSLNQVNQVLTDGTEVLSKVSNDIANSSDVLSSNTTQQAAAIQETTASVEETSAMIKKNADNARSSRDISAKSETTVAEGKTYVSAMIDTIQKISENNNEVAREMSESNAEISSIVKLMGEIGSKTKVINDIVFQTKLLSFNASVEAARAGEYGKGFAVVAEEVGKLAQMSGASANEISQILNDSIKEVEAIVEKTKTRAEKILMMGKDKVDEGKEVVNKCGQIFEKIVTDVNHVGSLIQEISTASEEQAKGIEGISTAMSELDKAAHETNSISISASGSANELKQQVLNLKRVGQDLSHIVHGEKKGFKNPSHEIPTLLQPSDKKQIKSKNVNLKDAA